MKKLQIGNSSTKIKIVADLGAIVQQTRKGQSLTQVEIAGLAQTGNRFLVDLENGKETIQLGKVLKVLELLGLELIVRQKGAP